MDFQWIWRCLVILLCLTAGEVRVQAAHPPNVVVFFFDDAGYGDFHPFGNPPYATPHVERLAREGRRFSRFFVPQAVCSASRAALLTGCYPERCKMFGALMPGEKGLDRNFATLAEVLKNHGYKTAIFGKWHLGEDADTRPAARGFDESSGLLLSNDMWDRNVRDPQRWATFHLPYWENDRVTCERVTPEFQETLTSRATADAVSFIERNKDTPFFLYVPYSMPHVPLYASPPFRGKSNAGLYGDVIVELDDSIGAILAAVESNGLEEDTIVLLSSDNGPWNLWGNHAGSTPFREAKNTSFNGGTQSPLVVKFPGRIEAGSASEAVFCSIDLLPTLCHATGAALPANEIDGRDVWTLVMGEAGASNPHAYYAITFTNRFEAVMSGDGRWKLHLPHDFNHVAKPGADGMPGEYEKRSIELSLFDLRNDPQESRNVIAEHPDVAEELTRLADSHRKKFYD